MKANMPREVYHYTTGQRFIGIIQDGAIKPSMAFVAKGERAAVWFTLSPEWDQTANKTRCNDDCGITDLSCEETAAPDGEFVRLVVDPKCAPYTWLEFVERSRIDKKLARALAGIAREKGVRIEDWRVAFRPIRRAYWLRVDVWRNGEWRPADVP
jgi:hypothetical protein